MNTKNCCSVFQKTKARGIQSAIDRAWQDLKTPHRCRNKMELLRVKQEQRIGKCNTVHVAQGTGMISFEGSHCNFKIESLA